MHHRLLLILILQARTVARTVLSRYRHLGTRVRGIPLGRLSPHPAEVSTPLFPKVNNPQLGSPPPFPQVCRRRCEDVPRGAVVTPTLSSTGVETVVTRSLHDYRLETMASAQCGAIVKRH